MTPGFLISTMIKQACYIMELKLFTQLLLLYLYLLYKTFFTGTPDQFVIDIKATPNYTVFVSHKEVTQHLFLWFLDLQINDMVSF